MEQITDNTQKYENYREQNGRLKKAMNVGFFLEAIFIEYAIIEDRIESALRHSKRFRTEKHNTLEKKLSVLNELRRNKSSYANKYFTDEIINRLYEWKKQRNVMIHALMKQQLHTGDLEVLAKEGQAIAKTISNKVSLYNRRIDKENS